MFKNFFRKVRATLKNSPEGIAAIAGLGADFLPTGTSDIVKAATKYAPNIATSQYQDNPIMALLQAQGITEGTSRGADYLRGVLNPIRTSKEISDVVPNNAQRVNTLQKPPTLWNPNNNNTATLEKKGSFLDKIKDFGGSLYDDDKLTGKGKLLGSIASGITPALATYYALMNENPQTEYDPKEYTSSVDDYYAAKARGEHPNPADFGLAPTPMEDKLRGLRYELGSDSFTDVATNRASGGIMELGMEEIKTPNEELAEVFEIRERANAPRKTVFGINNYDVMSDMSEEVMQAKTGGIVGLALGGNKSLEKRGMVNGPGGPKDDKIPAMLSNGEFVFTAKAVDNAGGPKAMYNAMNNLDPQSNKAPRGSA
jgi:hypothetical protein